MKELNEMLESIHELKTKYDKHRSDNRFNIFTALHKEHDEVNLHSRFISYLLSSESGHGMSSFFSTIFIRKILELNEDEFNLSEFIVIPNEMNKSEFKEIDILIINKTHQQAIIIENKIFARDSNREVTKNDGYDGQLERYYNTIKTGIDKNGKKIDNFQCDTVYIYYLSMFKPQPSPESVGKLQNVRVIYYRKEIRTWLETCLGKIPAEKVLLKQFIQQYLNLINKMTHNDIPIEERISLKDRVSGNWEEVKYLIDNFKHIKWHTTYEFWTSLKHRLEIHYTNVTFYPEEGDEFDKTITEITHESKDINYGILFHFKNGQRAYISGLNKLSWGMVAPKQWTNFDTDILENISFSDFSGENTYRLMNKKNMEEAIGAILNEVSLAQKRNFANLHKDD
jgi:hypothetical protein